VDEVAGVGRLEPLAGLHPEVDGAPLGKRPAPQRVPQRLALEELEDHVGATVVASHVEHREDVGMAQRRHRPRLVLEALEAIPAR
jgi:hypothetical protein